MQNQKLNFEIFSYDFSYDKRIIINKLTKGQCGQDDTAITDYAVLNGAKTGVNRKGERYGIYWLANTKDIYTGPMDMIAYGPDTTLQKTNTYAAQSTDKTIGIRPSIKFSEIEKEAKIISTFIYPKAFRDEIYHIIEYGEYPQDIADSDTQVILDSLYRKNALNKTGRSYSHDTGNPSDGLYCISDEEYEYEGNKYIRVENLNPQGILSNGKPAGVKKYYWVKVEPVKWLVDQSNDFVMSNKIIIGGVPYNSYITSCYKNTYVSSFIDHYFAREINQSPIMFNNYKKQSNQKISEPNQNSGHKVKVKVIRKSNSSH